MSRVNHTHIELIIDKSGSMSPYRTTVVDGVNAFIDRQRGISGTCDLTVHLFDTQQSTVLDSVNLALVQAFTLHNYYTGGSTALLDAIGQRVVKLARRFSRVVEDSRPERIVFVILTDGEENASIEYSFDDIKSMVDHFEDTFKWEFLYIGANQNAAKYGQRMGIKAGKALSYRANTQGTEHALDAAARAVANFRANGSPSNDEFFSEDDHDYQSALGAPRRN